MLPSWKTTTLAALVIGIATLSTAAQAKEAVEYTTQELVEALALQRFQRVLLAGPNRSAPPKDSVIVVLEGKALSLAPKLQSVPGMRVLTKAQLVEEQRANFLIITQLGALGNDIVIDYETPQNASFGSMRLQNQDGKLVFKPEESWRSSSGRRATYVRYYGGLACRDGTDMAMTLTGSRNGQCPVPRFPSTDSPFEW